MKIIIPMAGMGKRMRPHTLTTPKPLIALGGKPIVEHLIEEIVATVKEPIEEIAFITGHFGESVEKALIECANKQGAKAAIYYQEEALGTAHAILCAQRALNGPVIVAFADTIFFSSFSIKDNQEAVIWTKKVEDPGAFGVVLTDSDQKILGFKEKPKEFVSDLAIIGIYYFKDGANLKKELQYLIDKKISKGGEYQLTDALQNMLDKGMVFYSEVVDQWLDCGNKNATVDTHTCVLEHKNIKYIDPSAEIIDSVLRPPYYVGAGTCIENSVVGPCVSIGDGSNLQNTIISHSMVQSNSNIKYKIIDKSMLGNNVDVEGCAEELNLGDYSQIL